MSGQPAVVLSSRSSLSVRSLGALGLVLFLVFLWPGLCAGLLPCGLEREKGSVSPSGLAASGHRWHGEAQ
jgi:hypothetical protein